MNGRAVASALWRRRMSALVVLVVELAAVALWLALAPKQYTATATVAATPHESLLSSTGNFDDLETTLAELVDSRPVLSDVKQRVHTNRSVSTLVQEVSGQRIEGTVLIRISVEDPNKHTAADVANAIADVLPLHDPSGGLLDFSDAGRATVPGSFSSPDLGIALLAGIALGVVLAIATALIRESAVGTVDDDDQLADAIGSDVLARLDRPQSTDSLPAVAIGDPAAGQFRALRVSLEFAASDRPAPVIIFTSVVPDGADSWVVVNLAAALADVRHSVLVVDADFGQRTRHPALVAGDRPGVGDVLRGEVSVSEAIRRGPVTGIDVLPVGDPADASPASLIELRFHRLLADATQNYDIVLVAAAPLTESDDARVMSVGNAVVVTVPSGKVRHRVLRRATASLRSVHITLLGAVLLGSRHRRPGS